MSKRARIQINYRSGRFMVIECDDFTAKRSIAGGLTALEWTDAKPRPLFVGVDDVESVWEL